MSCRGVDACSLRDDLFGEMVYWTVLGKVSHSDTQLHYDVLFQDLCHVSVMSHDLHAILAGQVLYSFFVDTLNSYNLN